MFAEIDAQGQSGRIADEEHVDRRALVRTGPSRDWRAGTDSEGGRGCGCEDGDDVQRRLSSGKPGEFVEHQRAGNCDVERPPDSHHGDLDDLVEVAPHLWWQPACSWPRSTTLRRVA